jgi:hypothetical protein
MHTFLNLPSETVLEDVEKRRGTRGVSQGQEIGQFLEESK